MYFPIELNTQILAGAIVGWLIKRLSGNEALNGARGNRGTLIASGLVVRGALAGVFDAIVKFVSDRWEIPLYTDVSSRLGISPEALNWA